MLFQIQPAGVSAIVQVRGILLNCVYDTINRIVSGMRTKKSEVMIDDVIKRRRGAKRQAGISKVR